MLHSRAAAFLLLLGLVFVVAAFPAHADEFWCEGLDENGDGQIDEGCARMCPGPYPLGAPLDVAPGSSGATSVSLARAGTGYGWAYADTRSGISQVYVQVTATSGAADRAEVRISDGVHAAHDPRLVWGGATPGYGIVWVDERDGNPEVYFRLLDASGTPTGNTSDLNLSSSNGSSLNPAIAWNGTEFGVVWDDTKGSNRDIYFRSVTGAGTTGGNAIRVTSSAALQEQASIVWDGTQFGMSWTDERDGNREIYARRVDGAGGALGTEVRITTAAGISERSSIRATGPGSFGIAWQDARSGTEAIWYGPWAGPGYAAPAGTEVSAGGPARQPSLTTTGAEMVVAWTDHRASPAEVYARRVGADGTVLSAEARLTTGAVAGDGVAAVWHGSGAGIGYVDGRSASTPAIVLLGCGGADDDGDGVTPAGGDCNDANAFQAPGLIEACDALDNDCNGSADDTCRGTCRANLPSPPSLVYPSPDAGDIPEVVWDGSGYGVVWQDRETYPGCCFADGIYFRRLDADGNPASPSIRLPVPEMNGDYAWLTWNGTEYGVVYEQFNRTDFISHIAFQRIDAAGNPIGTPREVTTNVTLGSVGHKRPVLAWRQGEYGLLYADINPNGTPRAEVFERLDRAGRPLERARDVTDPNISDQIGYITPDATGFAIAYLDGLIDPYFRRLDRFGGYRGPALDLEPGALDQGWPNVEATPWGYAVTWTEDSGAPDVVGDIFYQRLDLDGTPVGGPVNVTADSIGQCNPQRHRLIWTGQAFLLSYLETVYKVQVREIDANGASLGPAVTVAEAPNGRVASPASAWNGSRPLVVWADSTQTSVGHPEIVSSYLTCCEDVPVPGLITGASWSDATTLTWPSTGAERYDRVLGVLSWLRTANGDFGAAVSECRNDMTTTSSSETADPPLGDGYFYLVRGDGVCWTGSYDDGSPSQKPGRDDSIATSPDACP